VALERTEEIGWTDRVKNEAVLTRVKEERSVTHTVKRRKSNWIGQSLRRNCLLKHVIERWKGREDEAEDVSRQ
jgi:hypothetical protein